MRIVFIGAGEITVMTARSLIGEGHEVVIIEGDRERIEELSDDLDCSFLHGDGSKPAILREVDPGETDILFCLSDSDEANMIASLVGRSMGFNRVVTSIRDPELEGICSELGLTDTIIPGRTISRYLVDLVRGVDILELSTVIKNEARFFTFTAGRDDALKVSELELPENTRVICFYREDDFHLADKDTKLREKDEVVMLTTSEQLKTLQERWTPKQGR